MSRFLVLIYEDEQKWIDLAEGAQQALEAHYAFNITRADVVVAGKALQPTSTATSLRRGDSGSMVVTDGPFVETKEALGGIYLIEADDLDAATALAQEVPAPFGGLEVRPVLVYGDGPREAPKTPDETASTYLALLYADESAEQAMTPAEEQAMLQGHGDFQDAHGTSVLFGEGLHRTPAARRIQVDDGSMAVTDGPFAETKEALGGFYVLQAADLDEAIAIASAIPVPFGGVELRPTMVYT